MGKIKKYKNIVERFLSGESGQRFFNFAYSIGAAIVIWGALFKILHLPGGNTLLSIGMGTEVLMFVLTAFDRPPREYNWEQVFPALSPNGKDDDGTDISGSLQPQQPTIVAGVAPMSGSAVSSTHHAPVTPAAIVTPGDSIQSVSEHYAQEMTDIACQMEQLRETTEKLNRVSQTLLDSYKAITDNSEGLTSGSTGYVEQMQALNRNISGLNTIYEIQLKSVSSQLDAIDGVNKGIKDICAMYESTAEQSRKFCKESEQMTAYMQQLNQVYAKMLQAMTINMYGPMGAAGAASVATRPAEESNV